MKKKSLYITLCLSAIIALSACGGKEETKAEESKTTIIVEKETEEDNDGLPEGQMYSYLTGEPVDIEIGTQRPFAIMINNIYDAMPQSGISQAEILYECLVESDITRLMGVFQDIEDLNKVGSIRSARHDYIEFAKDQEAIFTHYGQSVFAQNVIDAGYPTISGLTGYGEDVFYRGSDFPAPHNVFTDKEGLLLGLEYTGLTREYSEGYESRLTFNSEDTVAETGNTANKVTLPFVYSNPWFEYDAETGLYKRFQYETEHIDAVNGEQLTFENLIIQYASYEVISNDGHKDFHLVGSGDGLWISNGKAVEIRWERASENDKTTYVYADGSPVNLNPGKSYIAIVPTDTPVVYE